MNRIAELRKRVGWSQVELAGKLNIAQNTMSQYENGNREPSSRIVLQLADLFGVSPNYLLGEEEPEKRMDMLLTSVTKIQEESDPSKVNLLLKKGWRIILVREDKAFFSKDHQYTRTIYSLGWFGDPSSPGANFSMDEQLGEMYSIFMNAPSYKRAWFLGGLKRMDPDSWETANSDNN